MTKTKTILLIAVLGLAAGVASAKMLIGSRAGITATITQVSSPTALSPLSVFFDCSEVTASGVDDPFSKLIYVWDYDDPTSGNYATTFAKSKNVDEGPQGAHLYIWADGGVDSQEYNPTCTMTNPATGEVKVWAGSVIVNAADTVDQTYIYAGDGNYTGEPTGTGISRGSANTVEAMISDYNTYRLANVGNTVRLRVKRGTEVLSTTRSYLRGENGLLIDDWGSGANPILKGDFSSSKAQFTYGHRADGDICGNVTWHNIDLHPGQVSTTGTNTGGSHATVMTDTSASWSELANAMIGYTIRNYTDRSSGTVTANTISGTGTVTVSSLSGGVNNTWETGDEYGFGPLLTSTCHSDVEGQVSDYITYSNMTLLGDRGGYWNISQVTNLWVLDNNNTTPVGIAWWNCVAKKLSNPGNSGGNIIFHTMNDSIIHGCDFDVNGVLEHGIRSMTWKRGSIRHNYVHGTADSKHLLTIRSLNPALYGVTQPPDSGSRYIVIADNHFSNDNITDGGQVISFTRGATDDDLDIHNVIIDRNMWLETGPNQGNQYISNQGVRACVIRNNVVIRDGSGGATFVQNGVGGDATNPFTVAKSFVFNNSIYAGAGSITITRNITSAPNNVGSEMTAANNVGKAATVNQYTESGTNVSTIGTNASATASQTVGWADEVPTQFNSFVLQAGTYDVELKNVGDSSEHSRRDAYGNDRPLGAGTDIRASEYVE